MLLTKIISVNSPWLLRNFNFFLEDDTLSYSKASCPGPQKPGHEASDVDTLLILYVFIDESLQYYYSKSFITCNAKVEANYIRYTCSHV